VLNNFTPAGVPGSRILTTAWAAGWHIICIRALVDTANLFFPHPNFGDAVNRNVVQSEIEGGVHLNDVPPDTVLEVHTKNHVYTIVHKAWGQALISGHPEYCPSPVEVQIHGSTWGGSMIMTKYLGRGMHLEFAHPVHQIIITSRILDIRAAA
jgi:hypothetical protein